MMRMLGSLAVIGAAIALAGCNETMGAGPVVTSPPQPITRVTALPPDAACSREIQHFQSIVQADLATGNVEQKVFDQIQGDMARASSACVAGRGGEAHSIVAGSKAKHGYRA